ncbi:hypothetical protein ACPCIZ_30965 [Streptomyces cellulosae]
MDYLTDHEKRYVLPVQHGTRMRAVRHDGERLLVETGSGTWLTRAVISATGTWTRPFLLAVPGRSTSPGDDCTQ